MFKWIKKYIWTDELEMARKDEKIKEICYKYISEKINDDYHNYVDRFELRKIDLGIVFYDCRVIVYLKNGVVDRAVYQLPVYYVDEMIKPKEEKEYISEPPNTYFDPWINHLKELGVPIEED